MKNPWFGSKLFHLEEPHRQNVQSHFSWRPVSSEYQLFKGDESSKRDRITQDKSGFEVMSQKEFRNSVVVKIVAYL